MLRTNTDVLIVGAGPTGTALAIALQKAGVNHLLIDKLEEGRILPVLLLSTLIPWKCWRNWVFPACWRTRLETRKLRVP